MTNSCSKGLQCGKRKVGAALPDGEMNNVNRRKKLEEKTLEKVLRRQALLACRGISWNNTPYGDSIPAAQLGVWCVRASVCRVDATNIRAGNSADPHNAACGEIGGTAHVCSRMLDHTRPLSKSSEPLDNHRGTRRCRIVRLRFLASTVDPASERDGIPGAPSCGSSTKRIVEASLMPRNDPVHLSEGVRSGSQTRDGSGLEGLIQGLAGYGAGRRRKPCGPSCRDFSFLSHDEPLQHLQMTMECTEVVPPRRRNVGGLDGALPPRPSSKGKSGPPATSPLEVSGREEERPCHRTPGPHAPRTGRCRKQQPPAVSGRRPSRCEKDQAGIGAVGPPPGEEVRAGLQPPRDIGRQSPALRPDSL
ncbi:unnamed protein product [Trichogramma brassicae]|uniref:Uncharacterized protein n=1 Tax=Trichogramma brassicae TaxID=86971 RepID=A0A6H5HYQ8_9HYME|nr:unnamed protein product [Trichogramma brassicae]